MSDILTAGQIRHCRKKVEELVKELGHREKLFQDKISKMHKEHNDMTARIQLQVDRYSKEILDLSFLCNFEDSTRV